MDPRRSLRSVIDPKVRTVGFNAPVPSSPHRSHSVPIESTTVPTLSSAPPPLPDLSPASSLSPVMIPPPRHASVSVQGIVPVVGSYNPSDSLLGTSPSALSPGSRIDGSEFSEDMSMSTFYGKGNIVGDFDSGKVTLSFPGHRGEFMPTKFGGSSLEVMSNLPAMSSLTKVSVVNMPLGVSDKELLEKGKGILPDVQNEKAGGQKLKERTSKAERRAIQEAQRAAKTSAKGAVSINSKKQHKVTAPHEKKEVPLIASNSPAPEKKDMERLPEKDRKKDGPQVPQPRMQFDDKHRVEKAKKRAVVNQREARNIVELFRHLPQYVHGTQLPDLESRFFQLDAIHPSVYKVGLQYLAGDVTGGNARCIAMLLAFREAVKDYSTPPEKSLVRDLTSKIGSYVSFLTECRPLSISMGNAIRFLKNRIAKLPLSLSEAEAKLSIQFDIDHFINEKIVIADKAIVEHAITKIRDGDVLLTYGSSCVIEMTLLSAFEQGKQFRVVIVDSRPKLEGKILLRRLVAKGLTCTYTHINAVSYIMHEVTRVFLGAASVLSNGTVFSRVGTACVAMVAHAFRVPVMICCEAYKFHDRVQLDSICSNELGDPDVISKVPGREDVNYLGNWADSDNLQLLNLTYDATPSDYVSMIITDYGMVPPTSIPVILREYCREQIWI